MSLEDLARESIDDEVHFGPEAQVHEVGLVDIERRPELGEIGDREDRFTRLHEAAEHGVALDHRAVDGRIERELPALAAMVPRSAHRLQGAQARFGGCHVGFGLGGFALRDLGLARGGQLFPQQILFALEVLARGGRRCVGREVVGLGVRHGRHHHRREHLAFFHVVAEPHREGRNAPFQERADLRVVIEIVIEGPGHPQRLRGRGTARALHLHAEPCQRLRVELEQARASSGAEFVTAVFAVPSLHPGTPSRPSHAAAPTVTNRIVKRSVRFTEIFDLMGVHPSKPPSVRRRAMRSHRDRGGARARWRDRGAHSRREPTPISPP